MLFLVSADAVVLFVISILIRTMFFLTSIDYIFRDETEILLLLLLVVDISWIATWSRFRRLFGQRDDKSLAAHYSYAIV